MWSPRACLYIPLGKGCVVRSEAWSGKYVTDEWDGAGGESFTSFSIGFQLSATLCFRGLPPESDVWVEVCGGRRDGGDWSEFVATS